MPNGTLTVVDRTVFENYTLKPTEEDKFKKHENNYAAMGLAIFPFVFGILVVLESSEALGSLAARRRFLCTLPFLEFSEHDALRELAGLALLCPDDRSQFRARCFRQTSTQICAALVKATVIHLTWAPSLPAQTYLHY